jgi:sigma-E factor negative regulatory protein RseB
VNPGTGDPLLPPGPVVGRGIGPVAGLVVGMVAVLFLVTPAANAYRYAYGGAGDDDHRAVDLLRRAAVAMRATSYSGTRVISAWGHEGATTVLVDVEHVSGQGMRLSLRGGVAEETPSFLAGGLDTSAGLGHLTVDSLELLTDAYAVTLGRHDSVAGRPSTVVEVSRAGDVVARLWVDDASGMLLRREVFDLSGDLVRESTFIDIDVATSGFMAHLPPTAPAPVASDPLAHEIGLFQMRALETAGWDCPRQAGPMQLVDVETLSDGLAGGGAGALHLTYSDGLTRMSVFEQRGSLDADSVRGFARLRAGGQVVHVREGMTTYAMWEDDGLVFTAVTDAPLDTLARVVASRPPRISIEPGFWGRVVTGLTRLGGWATPLP